MRNRYSSTKNEAHLQLRQAAITIANLFMRYKVAPQTKVPVAFFASDQLTSREMTWGMRGFRGQLVTDATKRS